MRIKIAKIEKKTGYNFRNKELLLQALTHSSFAYEKAQDPSSDNEVLEFLGDAVIGLVTADFLQIAHPQFSEGELSKIKAFAASTDFLSQLARKMKLDKFILLGKGEDKSGGRKKKTILAGAFEALAGAVYRDGGFEAARVFLLPLMESALKKIKSEKFQINNYKSALQEYLQKEYLPTPIYRTVNAAGPDHDKVFLVEVSCNNRVLAKAKGKSKKDAEQRAAQKALRNKLGRKIRALPAEMFLLKRD